ncbi:tellurite resistance/C4-dicarboxylate transporter family protein [Bacillus sp. Marseille-P3661]|uniref:tellurite resistance/C4-dicarboxylate transporter family protein n=1 Tax=Bacillus sp. Marseille-P3661 TaxID=1936234 RepID=UPI000C823C79|nr:tellurite resistance/C4-dicarboxylate transporter family protein [Bacillus sp. Marseille-P3661]
MINLIKLKAKSLFPGYFALVMATGALSLAAYYQGMIAFSKLLVYFNVLAYLFLSLLTIVRLFKYFQCIKKDLSSHTRGPGFFTLVAGSCILGSQLVIVENHYLLATFLWGISILLWFVIMYAFFAVITMRKDKPPLAEGVNGAWLITAVSTHAVSILGTLLSSEMRFSEFVLFFSLCMYLLGCMLYLQIITIIFYRFTFLEFKLAALTPPYWINMGAVAITTLAGATLMLHTQNWSFLVEIAPFLKGFTLFFWVTGTWWIPLLFILTIWRHLYHRYPLTYSPQFWGLAFPLAMYTTSTYQLSKALNISFLNIIPQFMIYIAIAAWLCGLYALIKHLFFETRGHFNYVKKESSF